MATTKTIQATVKNRTDTAANWTQKNPVLAEGEIIVVQTSAGETRLKIGDGVKTFTQLPYTDEQIYNNVVTSVNGQTGDITTNSVEYTEQTLTDEQKKQARENIGAIDTANGLLPVECVLPFKNQTVFVKNGVMLPLDYSTATGDMKTAISRFSLLLMSQSITPDIIDAIVESAATLIKNGIFGDDFYSSYTYPSNVLYIYDSPFSPQTVIRMWSYYSASDSRKGFALRWDRANGNTFARVYNTTTAEFANNYISYTSIPLAAYASDSGDTPYIQQVEMKADPTTDMQIATKKYVDSSVPTIPTEVSSFENDAGYLTEHQSLTDYAKKTDIPTVPDSIKNPNALTFTGAATGTYDGSEAVTINIPEGGAGSLKKLTFTGAATGEYDGTTDVSIDIPSDIYVVPSFEAADTFDRDFDELVNAIKNHKILVLPEDRETIIIHEAWCNTNASNNIEEVILVCTADLQAYVFNINRTTKKIISQQFEIPMFDSSTLDQKSGSVYWDKDANKYVIKDISSTSGSSDYVINVTLDTKQSSIGNWVLGYSCTCDKTYAEVLAAYQSGAKVIAHVMRNKEITLSDGSKKTIPIINEAPLTRYIAAQNLLVFDYVHNATDLSVSSGGLTYTTGDSGDSMICYVATYQFTFGAADTSADSVQIPTTTKVQDMIDTSISSIGANEYTIQVSNTAPATGTSNKVITFVVEGE